MTISINRAIWHGLFTVYGPFLPLVFGLPALTAQFTSSSLALLLSLILGLTLAWLWWSWQVPRWRLWALRRVGDIAYLHTVAVRAGLEWPYGHFFERTEIKSDEHHIRELTLQLRYYLRQARGKLISPNIQMRSSVAKQAYIDEIDRFLAWADRSEAAAALMFFDINLLRTMTLSIVQQPINPVREPLRSALVTASRFMTKYQQVRERIKTSAAVV